MYSEIEMLKPQTNGDRETWAILYLSDACVHRNIRRRSPAHVILLHLGQSFWAFCVCVGGGRGGGNN